MHVAFLNPLGDCDPEDRCFASLSAGGGQLVAAENIPARILAEKSGLKDPLCRTGCSAYNGSHRR